MSNRTYEARGNSMPPTAHLTGLAPQRIVLPGINLSLAAIGSSLRLTVEAMRSHYNGLSAIRK
jgi:hypothetical protein